MNIDNNQRYIYLLNDSENEYTITDDEYRIICAQSLELYMNAKCNVHLPITNDFRSKQMLVVGMHFEKTLFEISEIAKILNESNIEYRVLKGIGIALTYPNPYTRHMGDIDLLIKKESHYEAALILEGLGYRTEFYDTTIKDVCYVRNNSLMIELHRSLYDDKDLIRLPDIEVDIWSKVHVHMINGVPVCVPSPEIHYKYQVFHMIKHFYQRGSGLRFLLDLKYFSAYYNIDKQELMSYFKAYGYEQFYKTLLNVMNFFFQPELVETKIMDKKSIALSNKMIAYILENGVYGTNNESSNADFRYYHYATIAKKSIIKTIQIIFFPGIHQLNPPFLYAKKYVWLLPIAWIHRVGYAIFSKRYTWSEKLFMFKKDTNKLKEKNKLLYELDLKDYIQKEV